MRGQPFILQQWQRNRIYDDTLLEIEGFYTIDGGTYNETTGVFTTSGSLETNEREGIISQFNKTVSLNSIGDYIEIEFEAGNGFGGNNQPMRAGFGWYTGEMVTENNQTSITNKWSGIMGLFPTRGSLGTMTTGFYKQADNDSLELMRISDFNSLGDLDYGGQRFLRPMINQNQLNDFKIRLEKISDTVIRYEQWHTPPIEIIEDNSRTFNFSNGKIIGETAQITSEQIMYTRADYLENSLDVSSFTTVGQLGFTIKNFSLKSNK